MKCGTDIKGSQRIYPNDFTDSLPSHIALLRDKNINLLLLSNDIPDKSNYCDFSQERPVNEVLVMYATPDICKR